jgi:plastocyanin
MTMLARIPADVAKRLLILSCAAALLTAACSNPPQAEIDYGAGVKFVPFVADNLDDAGLGNAIALDKDGIPYISYLIFPGKPAADAIPIPRPIGAPFISTTGTTSEPSKEGAVVGIASVSANGTWTRGAAAQVQDSPLGITIPYGPATVESLIGSTAENTNGTDIAIDANGGKHVVWAGRDGIWYAGAGATGAFKESASLVAEWTPALAHAGPLGRPSIAVDEAGTPWVAYTVDTATGQAVQVATLAGGKWTAETAATIGSCSGAGCSQPGLTEIGMTANGPQVVYVDGVTGDLMAATKTADPWTTSVVHAGIVPSGLSMIVGTDGATYVAYYAGGSVYLAASSGSGWTTAKVADANPGEGTDNLAQTTGVARDDAGNIYVTWYDKGKGVLLSSGDGSTFTPVETPDTTGGGFPSLAASGDGTHVFLAWYDLESQDLLLGVQGSVDDLLVAQPSPTGEAPPTSAGPAVECPKGGITLVAPSGASAVGFAVTELTAPADKSFTICFDNQDPTVPHNVDVFDSQGGTSLAAGSIIAGPAKENLEVPAQAAGTYFFQCDVHQTTMTGTITVK